MKTLQGLEMHRLLILARTLLIRARIAKQKAQHLEDFLLKFRRVRVQPDVLKEYRQEAYQFRKEAREALRLLEKRNGIRYLNGLPLYPLMINLNGRAFMNWPECQIEYENEILFQGQDPC